MFNKKPLLGSLFKLLLILNHSLEPKEAEAVDFHTPVHRTTTYIHFKL